MPEMSSVQICARSVEQDLEFGGHKKSQALGTITLNQYANLSNVRCHPKVAYPDKEVTESIWKEMVMEEFSLIRLKSLLQGGSTLQKGSVVATGTRCPPSLQPGPDLLGGHLLDGATESMPSISISFGTGRPIFVRKILDELPLHKHRAYGCLSELWREGANGGGRG